MGKEYGGRKELYLTEKQRKVLEFYTNTNMTQKEMSIEMYGNKFRQGCISNIVKYLNKKLGFDITKRCPRNKKLIKTSVTFWDGGDITLV